MTRKRILPVLFFLFGVFLLRVWKFHKPQVAVLPVTTSTETLSGVARDLTAIMVMKLLGSPRFSLADTEDNVIGIASGNWHTCAVISSGDVYCWGNNDSGQLGRETTDSPAQGSKFLSVRQYPQRHQIICPSSQS